MSSCTSTAAVKRTRREHTRLVSWNLAAINNNPFEYWITHKDQHYTKLMEEVESFVSAPGAADVKVSEVFSQAMFEELMEEMREVKWTGLDQVESMWQRDFAERRIISGFLVDKVLGKKRLASMPDRITNTINTATGNQVYRPTVINCYEGDLGSPAKWWSAWKSFMFREDVTISNPKTNTTETKRACQLLVAIKQAKYPDVTDQEEKVSLPLQTLCCAIFDAIMVHMMNTLAPATWQPLRAELCAALNKNKVKRTLEILADQYGRSDIIFLQEVSSAFAGGAQTTLGNTFDIHLPQEYDTVRDQNSVILTKKGGFQGVTEVTALVTQELAGSKAPVARGDILALTARDLDGVDYLLFSFHGDTNGLASIPVLNAVSRVHKQSFGTHRLLCGLDANTYEKEQKGYCSIREFSGAFRTLGLSSNWGLEVDPSQTTTFNARTFLQPQLNKAIKLTEKDTKGDQNVKDYLLFDPAHYETHSTFRDNTGERQFTEAMVIPSLRFPSDHCVVEAVLQKPVEFD